MAHAGQPTKQSYYIIICHSALTDWFVNDLLALEGDPSAVNPADTVM